MFTPRVKQAVIATNPPSYQKLNGAARALRARAVHFGKGHDFASIPFVDPWGHHIFEFERWKKRPTKKVNNRFRPPEIHVGRRQGPLA